MVEVVLRTFIPTEAINVPAFIYASNFVNGADNRGFNTLNAAASSRTIQKVDLDLTNPNVPFKLFTDTGITELYSKDNATGSSVDWQWELNEGAKPVEQVKLDKNEIESPTVTPTGENSYSINFDLEATNPVPPPPVGPPPEPPFAPAIDADITVEISRDEVRPYVYETSYKVSGTHDGFPAYELYIDNNLVYAYDPILVGKGPIALLPTPEAGSDVDIADGTSGTVSRYNKYNQDAEPGTAVGNTTGGFDTLAPTGSSVPFGQMLGEYTNTLLFNTFPFTANSLSFKAENFQTKPGDTFVLGKLVYGNEINGIPSNEELSGNYTTDLTIFSNSPISSNQGNFNRVLTEQINLNVTQDTFGEVREQNPDIISFADNPEFGSFHVYEGKKGGVELLGQFDNDGNLSFAGFGEIINPSTGFITE